MNKFIVTTSIHEPSEALRKFSQMPGWRLVVVGDLRSPHDAYLAMPNVDYLSPIRQANEVDAKLSDLIGWNNIQRRNMGFVYAMRQGAELIATTDDDNIPLARWGENIIAGTTGIQRVYLEKRPAFEPLAEVSTDDIWHRGYPIQWLHDGATGAIEYQEVRCDVQANLWDGEPDIDAICRATVKRTSEKLHCDESFTSNKPAPFNSQNTILTREALKSYFCFPGIGRADDIAASFVCQAHGNRVVFDTATVRQERNAHDTIADMKAEMFMYEKMADLVTALASDKEAWRGILPSVSADAWDRYRELVA